MPIILWNNKKHGEFDLVVEVVKMSLCKYSVQGTPAESALHCTGGCPWPKSNPLLGLHAAVNSQRRTANWTADCRRHTCSATITQTDDTTHPVWS